MARRSRHWLSRILNSMLFRSKSQLVSEADALHTAGYGDITTEIAPLGAFYYAEPYHQQYLAKNPAGYCPLHATGVSCSVG